MHRSIQNLARMTPWRLGKTGPIDLIGVTVRPPQQLPREIRLETRCPEQSGHGCGRQTPPREILHCSPGFTGLAGRRPAEGGRARLWLDERQL